MTRECRVTRIETSRELATRLSQQSSGTPRTPLSRVSLKYTELDGGAGEAAIPRRSSRDQQSLQPSLSLDALSPRSPKTVPSPRALVAFELESPRISGSRSRFTTFDPRMHNPRGGTVKKLFDAIAHPAPSKECLELERLRRDYFDLVTRPGPGCEPGFEPTGAFMFGKMLRFVHWQDPVPGIAMLIEYGGLPQIEDQERFIGQVRAIHPKRAAALEAALREVFAPDGAPARAFARNLVTPYAPVDNVPEAECWPGYYAMERIAAQVRGTLVPDSAGDISGLNRRSAEQQRAYLRSYVARGFCTLDIGAVDRLCSWLQRLPDSARGRKALDGITARLCGVQPNSELFIDGRTVAMDQMMRPSIVKTLLHSDKYQTPTVMVDGEQSLVLAGAILASADACTRLVRTLMEKRSYSNFWFVAVQFRIKPGRLLGRIVLGDNGEKRWVTAANGL